MDSSSLARTPTPKVEPKAEFVRDEYVVVTLPREAGSPYLNHPTVRLALDDALELHGYLTVALEKAGLGPSTA